MNTFFDKTKVFLSRVDRRFVRLLITFATLLLFVLAAGAPGGLGGIGM